MQAGELMGIAGASGLGKSTLLRLIAGLEEAQQGCIVIDGKLVLGNGICLPPEKRRVCMVFQDYGLFPHMTVSANIAYGLHGPGRDRRRERVREMLELVRMREMAARYPYELSGGQQQRVALARALAPKPKLLLLDEPFSNLDAALKEGIRSEMRDILVSTMTTCLFVSHDTADLEAVCGCVRMLG
jgi:iron(III) transport system ATP-binding protein